MNPFASKTVDRPAAKDTMRESNTPPIEAHQAGCCVPSRAGAVTEGAPEMNLKSEVGADDLVELPGGRFLMGTADVIGGFPFGRCYGFQSRLSSPRSLGVPDVG